MADIKIGIMRKCPQVRTYIKEIERARERESERINPVINGKIPRRNGPGMDDKQHGFILFGDGDRFFEKHNHRNVVLTVTEQNDAAHNKKKLSYTVSL